MSQHPPRPVYDFGGVPATAPSVPRVDVSGWILASGALGLAAGAAALNLLWRPLPGLDGPPGALSFHAGQALRWAAHWLSPRLFASDAKSYCALLAKLGDRERLALAWRGGAGLVAACAPSVLLARGCLAPRDGLIALRGSRRHEGRAAVELLRAEMAPRAKARPDHPIAPGLPYPADMWTRHVLVVAGTGAGKSTVLKPLIERVIAAGESLLLFDPKGEFTKGFGEPEIVGPWDARSLAWDIAKDMRNIGDMRRFAASMVREAHDPMWSNAARQLLVGFMIYLKTTRDSAWGWRELAEMLATPQASILPIMSEYHPEAVRAVERASVTTQGILINLASFSASIFDLAEAWGDAPPERRVSFVEWARQSGRHRQLILQGHGAYPDLTKCYLEGVVGTVSAIVNSVEMDDDESRKLWLIADECGQMGKMPIRALLELGRSRGFRCALACQDLAQLEEIYGALMVKAMVSMVGTILVGQMMQGDTAEQLCKALGTREVERLNYSLSKNGGGHSASSTTLSFSRDELAIYKPAELASRLGPTRDRKGVKFALLTGGDAYELFWPHYKMAVVRPAHLPAAWTRGFDLAVGGGASAGESRVGASFASDPKGASRVGARDEEMAPRADGVLVVTPEAPVGERCDEGALYVAGKAPTMPPPTADDVGRLLMQSVEVREHPSSPRHAHALPPEASAGLAHGAAAGGAGPAPGIGAHGPCRSGGAQQGASDRGSTAELLAAVKESISHIAGERAAHAVGGEAGALALRAAELLDALRPSSAPVQVVAVAQRPPSEDLEEQRKAKPESKAKGGPAHFRS